MGVRGVYINLDRSVERRNRLEVELEKLSGVGPYSRFAAIDGAASEVRPDVNWRGAVGCYLSHLQVLRDHPPSTDWLHVLEDDAVVSRFAATALGEVVRSPVFDKFDVLFTNCRIMASPVHLARLAHNFDRSVTLDDDGNVTSLNNIFGIELGQFRFHQTTSYLVNPQGLARVVAAISSRLGRAPFRQIDEAFSDLSAEGVLCVGCMVPFVTLQAFDGVSTTENASVDWEAPYQVIDEMLYADRDMAALRARLAEATASGAPATATREMIGEVCRTILAMASDA